MQLRKVLHIRLNMWLKNLNPNSIGTLGINKRRENEYYIHRDYMGNFISSETPPQLVWDTKLASQIRTFAVCVATGIVTKDYADAVEYISRTTTKYPYLQFVVQNNLVQGFFIFCSLGAPLISSLLLAVLLNRTSKRNQ